MTPIAQGRPAPRHWPSTWGSGDPISDVAFWPLELRELIDRWLRGDDTAIARHEARWLLAEASGTVRALGISADDDELDLIERYVEEDPACAAYLRLRELHRELAYIISHVIPPDAERFEGVAVDKLNVAL